MEIKRFQKNDASFICANCHRPVEPLIKTSRNHCPYCLWSLHVDVNPGDRANLCLGLMQPMSVITDPKKGYIIIHKCTKCGELHKNRAAYNMGEQSDNLELLIKLTAHQ